MEWIVITAALIMFGGLFYALYDFTKHIESN